MEVPLARSKSTISQKLSEAIYKRRPFLSEIMEKHGGKSLYDYTLHFFDVKTNDTLKARQEELFKVTHDLLKVRLGSTIADEVVLQLRQMPLVSTSDHHGPVTSPYFVNSNLISALPYDAIPIKVMKYIVVFSFAGISLNNASYPRGLMFSRTADFSLVKVPLFPDRQKLMSAYVAPAYTMESLESAYKISQKQTDPEHGKKLVEVMRDILAEKEVMDSPDFLTQVTKLNKHLWRHFFKENQSAIPDLIYLDIESLVSELLTRFHFQQKTLIQRFIFDKTLRPRVRELFNNHGGAFSIENGWGTYLFWGVDAKSRRVSLEYQDGVLVSQDGSISFALEPEIIAKALKEKKLFPSMLLCYLLVSLHYGMKCLGGFSQVNDLTNIKATWIKLLEELGEKQEIETIAPIQTKELSGDGCVVAYLSNEKSVAIACGMDILTYFGGLTFKDLRAFAQEISLEESFEPLLPLLYKVLYSSYERDPELDAVTMEQILKEAAITPKIHKWYDVVRDFA